jgi:transposase
VVKKRGPSKIFSEHEIKQLENNPNVQNVTNKTITYAPSFKVAAVRAYNEGQSPMEIFLKAGFDVGVIGHQKPKQCLMRWRDVYTAHGEAGLLEERRGKGSMGRPTSRKLSTEEKLKRAEARIKLLEAENDLLKKLEALERQKLLGKR